MAWPEYTESVCTTPLLVLPQNQFFSSYMAHQKHITTGTASNLSSLPTFKASRQTFEASAQQINHLQETGMMGEKTRRI